MRKDMAKVIVERPRLGHHTMKYRDVRRSENTGDYEDMPHKQSMTKPYGYNRKEFSDLLGPLWGFINSRKGKKWDDVYSEICEHLNRDKTTHDHIFGHLKHMIEINTFLVDGEIYYRPDYGWYFIGVNEYETKKGLPIDKCSSDFYVHPKTNIITATNWRERHAKRRKEIIKQRKDERQRYFRNTEHWWFQLHCKEGIWYGVALNILPQKRTRMPSEYECLEKGIEHPVPIDFYPVVLDAKLHILISRNPKDTFGASQSKMEYNLQNVYCKTYHQLTKKELKKYGLKNATSN